MRLYFIRHGATAGNEQRRYIGSTDESLSALGISQIKELSKAGLNAELIFASPMKRTLETAEILFPKREKILVNDFRETDFGIFEGKTAEELKDSSQYSAWLDLMCHAPIPGGESVSEFKNRACRAFTDCAELFKTRSSAAFIIHGGVIMAILEKFAVPQRDFYAYHIENGGYISCEYDKGILRCTDLER